MPPSVRQKQVRQAANGQCNAAALESGQVAATQQAAPDHGQLNRAEARH
jgi:hypothetical protein